MTKRATKEKLKAVKGISMKEAAKRGEVPEGFNLYSHNELQAIKTRTQNPVKR